MNRLWFACLFAGLILAAGCEESTTGNDVKKSYDIGEERLLAAAPKGWKEVFSRSSPELRIMEFIPEDQQNERWSEKITFESLQSNPLPDPIEFQDGLILEQRESCENFNSYSTFSGIENGYPTTVQLLVCKRSEIINQSQVTMLKAIQGNEHFYVISLAQRSAPLADDAKAMSDEEIAAWSLYLRSISVCDDTPEHRCPEPG
jgi:hypothetical protein